MATQICVVGQLIEAGSIIGPPPIWTAALSDTGPTWSGKFVVVQVCPPSSVPMNTLSRAELWAPGELKYAESVARQVSVVGQMTWLKIDGRTIPSNVSTGAGTALTVQLAPPLLVESSTGSVIGLLSATSPVAGSRRAPPATQSMLELHDNAVSAKTLCGSESCCQ